MISKKILSYSLLTLIVLLAACKKDTYEQEAVSCPVVKSTSPEDNATNVNNEETITVTFNKAVDPKTIDTLSIVVEGVRGAVSYNELTATFSPLVPLPLSTTFIGRVKASVKDVRGNALQEEYLWSFTTAATLLPRVASVEPADFSTGVALNKTVVATFNMAMDPATINSTSFTLKQSGTLVGGNISYNGNSAFFDPTVDFSANTVYTASITTDAENTAGVGLTDQYDWTFTTGTMAFNPSVNLNSVERFGMIAGTAVSNNAGPSQINNLDVGVSPGLRSSITGFLSVDGGPGLINNGNFFAADDAAPIPAMLLQAKNDLNVAYLAAEGASSPAPATVSGDIGGQTLAPGIYKSTSTLSIQNGNLTLDGQGDPNAEWIFQVASDFTTFGGAPFPSPAGGNVILIGGAQAKNIYWQVGSSATIGDYTSFNGNVLALTSVTMNAFSQAVGRMLCTNGAVTMTSTNTITKP